MTPRRLAGVLATIVALGLTPQSGGARVSATLVAIQYESNAASLVRVDPVSLERVDDSAISLDRDTGGFTFSPEGTEVAFGSNGTTMLHLYDLVRMKARPSFEVARGPGSVWVIAWPKADRLLAFVQSCCSKSAVLTIDPEAGRVLARSPLHGEVRDAEPTPDGAALLVAPANAIGPARLALVDADGAVRRVTVARVQVGFKPKPSIARARQVVPGLAVDGVGRRIFLVQAHGPTAEIGLQDLSVSYHAIRASTRRLAAAQKEFRGPWRSASYLGGGMLAVSGFDGVRSGDSFSFVPAGLMVIDTRDWTVRTIDKVSTGFTFAPPLLLVLNYGRFVAYSVQGQKRFQIDVDQPLGYSTTVGSHAYVWLKDNSIAVIDLDSAAIVNTTAPKSLLPIALAPPN